jgi:nicotinamidase-related amidase
MPSLSSTNLLQTTASVISSATMRRCAEDPGAEMDPRIGADGFPLFTKSTSDGFANPKFLALTGVMAEGCVRATANSALRHGFRVELLADAVESNQEWKKKVALWFLRQRGATIQTCAEFLETTRIEGPQIGRPVPRILAEIK